jgi:tetratricopeptide (TPR) repeat protein
MRYKGSDKPLPQIARELGVEALIEGSVLRVGERVRITAKLIKAATDQHLWAESYERDMRDVLLLQRDVARDIAEAVRIRLTPDEQASLGSARPVDPEAHEAYLRGRFHISRFAEQGWRKGAEYFEEAVRRDPTYALAHAALADTYGAMGYYSVLSPREAYARSRSAAQTALKLDDRLAWAHSALGMIALSYDWKWDEAERELRRATELSPGSAIVHDLYSWYLSATGRFDEARRESHLARSLDPLFVGASSGAAWVEFVARRYDDAIEQYRRTIALDPGFFMARRELGIVYLAKGMNKEAIQELEHARRIAPDFHNISALSRAYAAAGRVEEARKLLGELLEISKTKYVGASEIAGIYMELNDFDRSFEWLDKAYKDRSPALMWLKVGPFYDPLRTDPRFQELLRRMGLPPD